jgi:hypothetical protein
MSTDTPVRHPIRKHHNPDFVRPMYARHSLLGPTPRHSIPERRHGALDRIQPDPRRTDPRRQLALQPGHLLQHMDGARSAQADGRDVRQEHDRQGRVPADGRAGDALRDTCWPSCGTRPSRRAPSAPRPSDRAKPACWAAWRSNGAGARRCASWANLPTSRTW